MMKKTNFKKAMSLFVACLMVLTCWVWVAPTEAQAKATTSTYAKADKYGTPVWDGGTEYESRWNSGSSYTTFKWADHIYLDISETLESAGYYFDVEWDYGNGTNYRIVNNGFIFGGWGIQNPSGWPENYNTMNRMFSNYDLDASTHGTQLGVDTESSTDFDLRVGGDNWDGAAVIIWRNPSNDDGPQYQKVFLMGTPNEVGTGLYSTSGAKPTSFGGWQEWKKPNIFASTQWTNASDKYVTGNDSGNWTTNCYEGTWKEVRFEITVYDKANLSDEIDTASNIKNASANYADLERSDKLSYLETAINTASAVLKTREQEQAAIDKAETDLYNVASPIYFQASTAKLEAAFAAAEAIMNASDYEAKYTQSTRQALEAAYNNAKAAGAYSNGRVDAYGNSNLVNELSFARSEQNNIDAHEANINNAIGGLKEITDIFTITFNFFNGETTSAQVGSGEAVTVPENTTKDPDAAYHYVYTWDSEVSEIATGDATYNEIETAIEHEWSEWGETLAPTCTEEGTMMRTCACGYFETDSVDALDHDFAILDAVDPTCTETGLTEGKDCSRCDLEDVAQEVIPARGHDFTIFDAVDPTCTETGLTEGKDCSRCDLEDAAQEVIPARGHDFTIFDAIDPTCTETGLTEGKDCSRCDLEDVAQEVIPELGHDYDETKSEANLTRPVDNGDGTWSKGYYTYTCKNDADHTKTEDVERADYTAYEAAEEDLAKLLEKDLTDEAKAAINAALEANVIADNLIETEQATVDAALENIQEAIDEYKDSLNVYKVTFVVDGAETETEVVSGNDATAPDDVTKAPDADKHYIFIGWDKDFTNVTEDLVVTAIFTEEAHHGGQATCERQAICSVCDTAYGNTDPDDHIDEDLDGKCDDCTEYIECQCICHSENSFLRFIYRFIMLFSRILNVNRVCACGEAHYESLYK